LHELNLVSALRLSALVPFALAPVLTAAMLAATVLAATGLTALPSGLLLLLAGLVLSPAVLLPAVSALLVLLTGLVLAALALLIILAHVSFSCETIPAEEQPSPTGNVPIRFVSGHRYTCVPCRHIGEGTHEQQAGATTRRRCSLADVETSSTRQERVRRFAYRCVGVAARNRQKAQASVVSVAAG
jgi:hypothetical protein